MKEKERIYEIRANERRAAHDRAGVSRVGFTRYIKAQMTKRSNK